MADFEFGDFVTVDNRWRGVVIGVRFDLIRVALADQDQGVGLWNRDRLELDAGANARRRLRHAQARIAEACADSVTTRVLRVVK